MHGPSEIAVGGPDFSFRKRLDGGYTITQRGALGAPLTLDHALIGWRYLHVLRDQHKLLRIKLGRDFLKDAVLSRRWKNHNKSPFEEIRTMDPPADTRINKEAMINLSNAWPVFEKARIRQTWAGMMDVTPDSLPVISSVDELPGLTIATGFSGHGFGTAPAAGQLAADIVSATPPIVDPSPYRLDRF
jgi:glycine/D-amino acid oxidase-like deaminating enzyme